MSRHTQTCWIYSLNMHFLHLLVCVCLYVCMYASFHTYLSINSYDFLLNTWHTCIVASFHPGLSKNTETNGVFYWNPSLLNVEHTFWWLSDFLSHTGSFFALDLFPSNFHSCLSINTSGWPVPLSHGPLPSFIMFSVPAAQSDWYWARQSQAMFIQL